MLSRHEIFTRVWGYDFGAKSNSLTVYIGYLRRKTEAGGESRLIHTVRGVGYVLHESAHEPVILSESFVDSYPFRLTLRGSRT